MHSIQCQKLQVLILALDRKFLKPRIPLLELLIQCQKRTCNFLHQIESLNDALKTFDLVPNLEVLILALDQKFLNYLNWYLWLIFSPIYQPTVHLIWCQNWKFLFWHQIKSLKKTIFRLFKALLRLSIQCQKRTCNFFTRLKVLKAQNSII